MAATSSTAWMSTASVNVAVERQAYTAGDCIRGYVELDILEHKCMRAVSIELIGQGQTAVEYQKGGKQGGVARAKETNTHARVQANVVAFPQDEVPIGVYQCPFEIQIPDTVRPNLTHVQKFPSLKDGHTADIVNFLSVRCHPPEDNSSFLIHVVPIQIFANPADEPQPGRALEEFHFGSTCWTGGGALQLSITVDRVIFGDEETISATCTVDNRSQRAMDYVEVSLVRESQWSARGQRVQKSSVDFVQQLPPVASGQKEASSVPITLRKGLPASVDTSTLTISYGVMLVATTSQGRKKKSRPHVVLPAAVVRTSPMTPEELLQGRKGAGSERSSVRWAMPIAYTPRAELHVDRVFEPGVLSRLVEADPKREFEGRGATA